LASPKNLPSQWEHRHARASSCQMSILLTIDGVVPSVAAGEEAMAADAVFRIAGLTKSFGPNRVLRGVDLDLRAGAATVLMGANGAGKSPLVKVISGVHGREGGTMTLAGRPFDPASPADAIRAGVVTVHQN